MVIFRVCYYTSESSMRRSDFMRMINKSFPKAGLTCSFQDNQLSELIQIKRRSVKNMPCKQAVNTVGPQDSDGHVWVLNADAHISEDGNPITTEESNYIWIGHLYSGPGVADHSSACKIHLPLSIQTLTPLLENLKLTMKHNFFPSLFVIASFGLALHYTTIQQKFKFCPVPIAFGKPGTGKTTALKCGLAILGALHHRFWSCATKEMYVNLCSDGYLPLGLDDPKSKAVISDLCMSLYGGAFQGSLLRGGSKPTCMAVISANFIVSESEKYVCCYASII